ncbi:hypothetical protein J3R30DRAFT_3402804 [Lentinula aciculospora]|uniref:Uncharacterized protein n=1 Tax=Lentinula aciculospora TaxID=153920 RepID=A0A9W9AHT9_9AGAR|nr:hypothetical protein J3R30DRAFT_3402804 [Lentinula aciculospora]
MSSSSSSSTSSASSSTETTSTSQGPSTTNQGNLYLSFVLRRRYQRRLAEALAAGAVLAPRAQGSRKKRFRTRPKFFETWLSDAEKNSWPDVMPVSVLLVKTKKKPKQTEPIRPPTETRTEAIFQRFLSHLRFVRRSSYLDADSNPPSPGPDTPSSITPVQEKPDPSASPATQKNLVQVAVLVAMPSPRRLSAISSPEEQLPEVVFGVTRLHCRAMQSD